MLRGIEDEGSKRRVAEIVVYVSTPVALLSAQPLSASGFARSNWFTSCGWSSRRRYAGDCPAVPHRKGADTVPGRSACCGDGGASLPPPVVDFADEEEEEAEAVGPEDDDDDEEDTPEQQTGDAAGPIDAEEAERRRKRRRRRRRGGRRDKPQISSCPGTPVETAEGVVEPQHEPVVAAEEAEGAVEEAAEAGEAVAGADDDPRNRRRGRVAGVGGGVMVTGNCHLWQCLAPSKPELQPVYAGPTPGISWRPRAIDIFDVMDQAERAAEAQPASQGNIG